MTGRSGTSDPIADVRRLTMLAHLAFGIDLQHWEIWAAPAIGLGSAGLALLVGHVLLGKRRRSFQPPVAESVAPPVDPFAYGSATERRSSVRRRGKQIKVLISDAEALEAPVEGWVMDRSMGGLCLLVYRAMEPGSILSVRTAEAPQTTPWVQVEIKNCRHNTNHWVIGCQYVRTPPWGVLLLFG
jgi:hypothetical protein